MLSVIVSAILISLTTAVLYAASIILRQYTYWKRRGILHLDLMPLIGNNYPIFLRQVSLPIHSQNLYNKFPGAKYFGMFDLKSPMIFIKDPSLIREVCVRSFDNFVDHDIFVTEEMDPVVGRNLFSLQGQRWKDMRNTLNPSFSSSKMKYLFNLIAECAKDFARHFVERPDETGDLEIRDAFTRYTSDVIATAAFGVKVDSMSDRNNQFYLHGKAATAFSPSWIVKFELLRNFPKLMHALGATFLPKATDRFFKRMITETVKTRREKNIVRRDIIQLMMEAMDNEDNLTQVEIEDIIGQAFVFFLAGFDTSAGVMSFMAYELAANPCVQDRLYREISERYKEDNAEITYDSLFDIPYLDMVISETLRLYPPAAIVNRVCIEDFDFPPAMDGYPPCHLEKGTKVLLSLYGLHRDPAYFPEPDKFDPERFTEKNRIKMKPYTYIPFGVGPRQCIASRFALMEVKLVIINLLRNFVIKFTEKTQHPVVFDRKTFNMSAEGGIWLGLERRKC